MTNEEFAKWFKQRRHDELWRLVLMLLSGILLGAVLGGRFLPMCSQPATGPVDHAMIT